jgi:hypothetical protein
MMANRLAILGLGFLAVVMTGAIMLITDLLYGSTTTIVVTVVVGRSSRSSGTWSRRGDWLGSGSVRTSWRG